MMKNQTLVDWFVVSGGIHFEAGWASKDEMKIEEKDRGRWEERVTGRKRFRNYESGGQNKKPLGTETKTNLLKLFNIRWVRKY